MSRIDINALAGTTCIASCSFGNRSEDEQCLRRLQRWQRKVLHVPIAKAAALTATMPFKMP